MFLGIALCFGETIYPVFDMCTYVPPQTGELYISECYIEGGRIGAEVLTIAV